MQDSVAKQSIQYPSTFSKGCGSFAAVPVKLAIVAAVLLSANLAVAQSREQNWARCTGTDLDLRIAGCTALIQSGQETNQNLSNAFYDRGIVYDRIHEYDRAINDFDNAIRLNPSYAPFVGRAQAYIDKGDYDRGIQDTSQAIQFNPKDFRGFSTRGIAYLNKAEYDRAVQDFDVAVRLSPSPTDYLYRSVAYEGAGAYEAAIQDANQVIRLDPKNPFGWDERCLSRAAVGELPSALADCMESLRLKADNPKALDSEAFVYLKMKAASAAESGYNAALAIYPKISSSLYGRGLAENMQGAHREAEKDFAAALKIDPDIANKFRRLGAPMPPLHTSTAASASRSQAGVVSGGKLLHMEAPVYPAAAELAGISGPVVLSAVIDKYGSLQSAKVISGEPWLRQAAIDAVSKWAYQPYERNGEPVEVATTVTVNFVLPPHTAAAPPVATPVAPATSTPVAAAPSTPPAQPQPDTADNTDSEDDSQQADASGPCNGTSTGSFSSALGNMAIQIMGRASGVQPPAAADNGCGAGQDSTPETDQTAGSGSTTPNPVPASNPGYGNSQSATAGAVRHVPIAQSPMLPSYTGPSNTNQVPSDLAALIDSMGYRDRWSAWVVMPAFPGIAMREKCTGYNSYARQDGRVFEIENNYQGQVYVDWSLGGTNGAKYMNYRDLTWDSLIWGSCQQPLQVHIHVKPAGGQ